MLFRSRALVFVLLSATLSSCTSNKVDLQQEQTKLINTSKAWSAAAQTNNMENILSYWADDAVVMSPGRPSFKGKPAIRSMVEESKKIPGFEISWEPLQASVAESGDMGYLLEKQKVSFIDSLGNRIWQTNRAVTIWKKDKDGNWKNVVDVWNAEAK